MVLVNLMLVIDKYMNHTVKRMETTWENRRGLIQKNVIKLNGFENMIF